MISESDGPLRAYLRIGDLSSSELRVGWGAPSNQDHGGQAYVKAMGVISESDGPLRADLRIGDLSSSELRVRL